MRRYFGDGWWIFAFCGLLWALMLYMMVTDKPVRYPQASRPSWVQMRFCCYPGDWIDGNPVPPYPKAPVSFWTGPYGQWERER